MKLVNLTPHTLNIHCLNSMGLPIILVVLPERIPARRTERRESAGAIITEGGDQIELFRTRYGELTGLPDPVPGVVYVTSMLAAERSHRADVYCPGAAIRDDAGNIIGCDELNAVNPPLTIR